MLQKLKRWIFLRKLNKQLYLEITIPTKATIVNHGQRGVDTLEIHVGNDFCHVGLPSEKFYNDYYISFIIEYTKKHLEKKNALSKQTKNRK